jgi:hypothetical protein
MPWKQVYVPPPQDMSLRVWHKNELPPNVRFETIGLGFRQFEEASLITDTVWLHWYECRHCNGWIEGYANQYSVNTLDSSRLAGRRGTEWYCRRCGEQIAFLGMMS